MSLRVEQHKRTHTHTAIHNTLCRFRRGLDSPLRMRRVDDFGFTIPSVLGPERFPRFVGDQLHLIQLRSQQKLLQVSACLCLVCVCVCLYELLFGGVHKLLADFTGPFTHACFL